MMTDTIIVSIIGGLGVVISSLLTHMITRKEMKIKEQQAHTDQMSQLVEKYKDMCEDLEKKVDVLEKKVEKLESENNQLRNILISHGIEIITSGSE